MQKGDIYWAELGIPTGSEPGHRRPVLVVQSDLFNNSAIDTVLIAPITGQLHLARAPGNIRINSDESGLPKDSVVNVSAIMALNKTRLRKHVASLDPAALFMVDNGIKLVFDL